MATISLTIKDPIYAAELATFEGATDAERLTALKQWIRGGLRDRAQAAQVAALRESQNAAMRDLVANLGATLAD